LHIIFLTNRNMALFVDKNSVVRQIWGKGDTILFIFAGASAEFALNKAVDWLYFTGKLPADPIGRLFSTVCYARLIVFSDVDSANKAIDNITEIHSAVEKNRSDSIPDWAYRDVLFLLIYYSITSFELLERKLNQQEKEEVFNIFYKVGCRMKLKNLPVSYEEWKLRQAEHLKNDLQMSEYTIDLYRQYKKHLGSFRYKILLETQKLVLPDAVREMLKLKKFSLLQSILPFYKISRWIKLDGLIKSLVLPSKYKKQIKALDSATR
jgi:uncharacterized protein (DUF2236 family)